ncbi:DUF3870 domain-containing protein [Paramaledivibacter caminithermalis]|uniref:DUF3870 domain-containing protein n=1 Tax=Paramaledivibacter caminithermalis (strain DSM 15212 / CIP 107654 / DViRD3) TaxID=1121301 RepID=A0A1M6N0K0_PARC5|nr:DUF3870 domain-containing protein [Paramaledivibacter caminithermalis]SHJ89204.1 protein of unknown function [Paramaledivibacter caminithermalis DSM 15212]
MEPNEIFLTGYAKLPKGITATELYHVIAVGLIVDKETGIILDADCSLVTRVAKEFFKDLVVGKDLNNYQELQRLFKEKYFGSAKKALISALKICNEKFKQILENSVEVNDN